MRGERWQIALILLLILTTGLFGVFFYRELFPEYKEYQKAYIAIEEFRSSLTGEAPAPFKQGVKQLVIAPEDNGPEVIDRCTSCHVAMKLSHFSPTRLAKDINGNFLLDAEGFPVEEPNPGYIFGKIEERIQSHPEEADRLRELLAIQVDGKEVDLKKVLGAHPLMGREQRPFEYHSIDEQGCTSCHGGNGRALTSMRAHGPVYDGKYPAEHGHEAHHFLETDEENDPPFASVFNHKPGHELLFQTTPILVGSLIEANCVQCHRSTSSELKQAVNTFETVQREGQRFVDEIEKAFNQEKEAVATLLQLKMNVKDNGYQGALEEIRSRKKNLLLPFEERQAAEAQENFLMQATRERAILEVDAALARKVGDKELLAKLNAILDQKVIAWSTAVEKFVEENQESPEATGTLFVKARSFSQQSKILENVQLQSRSLERAIEGDDALRRVHSDIDLMTANYQRGQNLYLSQACYACHRIAGFARGGVGPELTLEGKVYPWFIKESIVWPQADLATSTMPNFRMDHDEIEDLMTFLLAQNGKTPAISEVDYDVTLRQWEEGKRLPFEQPVPPAKQHDVDYGLTIFATEGCAACHRLKGYSTNVGFALEKEKGLDKDALHKERLWFQKLFPELIAGRDLPGSMIVSRIERHAKEIDQRIVSDVRSDGLIEKIENDHPQTVESYLSTFKYALRAKEDEEWKERVRRVMYLYAREYGLGRLIGPRPNWSGVYRDDEWLVSHFYNPQAHVAKSIMPVFAFDKTKFFALTYMLDMIGKQNQQELQKQWDTYGYSPEISYNLHCAQCHGTMQQKSYAPVAEWVYPIPKNLRSPDYLRNLGKERSINSIIHGVAGGPMPPWGELGRGKPFINTHPVITEDQARQLIDWIFQQLPGQGSLQEEKDNLKWKYDPQDVIEELNRNKKVSRAKGGTFSLFPSLHAGLPEITAPVTVEEIFDVVDDPVDIENQKSYYIKRSLYTPENLSQGQYLFMEHCAICHGAEGGGNGLRAATMVDAKPRMLANLPWARSRDDLRWLRSIKYGVQGTSMTAWGDMTTPLQRLQLVMYVRNLTRETDIRNQFTTEMYETFEVMEQEVLKERITIAEKKESAEQTYYASRKQALRLEAKEETDAEAIEEAVKAFQQERLALKQLEHWRAIDRQIASLIQAIRDEKQIYETLGSSLLARSNDSELMETFFKLIRIQRNRFSYRDGELTLNDPVAKEQETQKESAKYVDRLKELIRDLERREEQAKGKLPSVQRFEALEELRQHLKSLQTLLDQSITEFQEAFRMVKDQKVYFYRLLNELNPSK